MTPSQLKWHRDYWVSRVKSSAYWIESCQKEIAKNEKKLRESKEALRAIEALMTVDEK